jgi:hypothetical protein
MICARSVDQWDVKADLQFVIKTNGYGPKMVAPCVKILWAHVEVARPLVRFVRGRSCGRQRISAFSGGRTPDLLDLLPQTLLRTHALLRKGNPPVLNVIPGGPLFVYLAEEIDDRVGSGDEDRPLLLETAKGIPEVEKRDMATEDWAQ